MSLLDLRKQDTPSKNTQKPIAVNHVDKVSADEFIEGANRYANGLSNVVSIRDHQAVCLQQEATNSQPIEYKPFRRATFTLSENCIDALTQFTNQHDYAKSHLIRIMINHFDQMTYAQQKQVIRQHKHRDR